MAYGTPIAEPEEEEIQISIQRDEDEEEPKKESANEPEISQVEKPAITVEQPEMPKKQRLFYNSLKEKVRKCMIHVKSIKEGTPSPYPDIELKDYKLTRSQEQKQFPLQKLSVQKKYGSLNSDNKKKHKQYW